MNFTSESVMHDIEVALRQRTEEDWSNTDRLLLKAQLHIASLQRQLDHKELTDDEWNKAFDFYCETDEGVLKFDLELRDEWKKEQLIRWKEALRKAQEK